MIDKKSIVSIEINKQISIKIISFHRIWKINKEYRLIKNKRIESYD